MLYQLSGRRLTGCCLTVFFLTSLEEDPLFFKVIPLGIVLNHLINKQVSVVTLKLNKKKLLTLIKVDRKE